jgi:putative DNA primase/helicase
LLLAGDLVIAIDNCEAPLGGQFLCSMLTQQTVRPRILGRSEAPELPSNAFVTATGNNLTLLADLTRRASLCRLDPKTERPELRIFSSHPVRTAKASRARYLVAALTILRAYHIAGRPQRCEPLGSFEGWSDWVRSALIWLGQADPVGSMDEVRATDPRLQNLTTVLTQWWSVIGSDEVTVSTIIDRANAQYTPHAVGGSIYRHPDFREALLAVAGHDGVINGKRLGKWLASTEHRIVQGLRIMRGGVSAGTQRWCVKCDGHAAAPGL